jgi:hypothetical protein
VRGALKKQNLTYDEPAKRLKKYGYKDETRASIANKLLRGTFPSPFLLAALTAMGLEAIRLEDV